MNKKRVLIVGGGFGGLKVALDLYQNENYSVALMSDQLSFRYYPSLYRTATGGRRVIASLPLSEIFENKEIEFIHTYAVSLNRSEKYVIASNNNKIPYDYLVLALGVQTNYFNIKGLEHYSYGIKTLYDAEKLKNHLHQQLIDEQKPDFNYVVVGGGPTGVELAGALPAYLKKISKQHGIKRRSIKVDLVEAEPRLLPKMPKDMSRAVARRLRRLGIKLFLNSVVKSQTDDTLMVNDRKLDTRSVIWTAGVLNNPFFTKNGFQVSDNRKVRVNQFLQSEKDIFVIGDNADTPYSGLAQTALHDGEYVSNFLKQTAENIEPTPYEAKRPVYVIPGGPNWAAVLWGRVRIYGRLGALLRRVADLIAYHDYEPWQLASKRWMAEDEAEEHCPICSKL